MAVVDLFAVFLALYYVWKFSVYFFAGDPLISHLASVVILAVLLFALMKGVAFYIVCSNRVMRRFSHAFLRGLVGLGMFMLVIIYDFDFLRQVESAPFVLLALVAWFAIRGQVFSSWFSRHFPVGEDDARMMMYVFPPRSFHDMWSMHLFMLFLLLVMPYIARFYWGAI